MNTMQAVVQHPDVSIKLEDARIPELGNNPFAPHDVLCEVEYTGICGSDIHKWIATDEDKAVMKSLAW